MIRSRTLGCGWLVILLLAANMPASPAQAQTGPIDGAEIDKLLTQFNVPGISIAVIKDFKIDWARGYGLADVKRGYR